MIFLHISILSYTYYHVGKAHTHILGYTKILEIFIFRVSRKREIPRQNTNFFILRARIFIFTPSEPSRSPDHFAHLVCQNRTKKKASYGQNRVYDACRESQFSWKYGCERSNFVNFHLVVVLYNIYHHFTLCNQVWGV